MQATKLKTKELLTEAIQKVILLSWGDVQNKFTEKAKHRAEEFWKV